MLLGEPLLVLDPYQLLLYGLARHQRPIVIELFSRDLVTLFTDILSFEPSAPEGVLFPEAL